MLWACFSLPQLPLESVFDAVDAETPQALFDGPANRPLIAAANATAQALGVRPGHSLAAARAYATPLDVRRRQPRAEADRLDTLAAWAYGFSSQVTRLTRSSTTAPVAAVDKIALEVGASFKLFDGWPRIEQQLRTGLARLGHRHHLSAAPSRSGAALLAAAELDLAVFSSTQLRHALAGLALDRCGLPARQLKALQSVGWRRLGEVLRAPRPELARRFGAELPHWLDCLLGDAPEPCPLFRPPDRFARLIEFDHAIESLETLAFPLQRLCRDLNAYLSARAGGVQRFSLLCSHDDAPATIIEVGLRRAQHEVQALLAAARGKLEHTPLPGPIRSLALHADQLPPFVPERRDLFDPTPRGDLNWPALHERLSARLREGVVRGLATYPDHRPERAWRVAEADEVGRAGPGPPSSRPDPPSLGPDPPSSRPGPPSSRPGPPSSRPGPPSSRPGPPSSSPPPSHHTERNAHHGDDGGSPERQVSRGAEDGGPGPALRPLWLLPRARPLRQPILRLLTLPERIETGWWDGDDVRRDYVVAELADGQRAWLYREAGSDGAWCLQGWFG